MNVGSKWSWWRVSFGEIWRRSGITLVYVRYKLAITQVYVRYNQGLSDIGNIDIRFFWVFWLPGYYVNIKKNSMKTTLIISCVMMTVQPAAQNNNQYPSSAPESHQFDLWGGDWIIAWSNRMNPINQVEKWWAVVLYRKTLKIFIEII